MDWFLYCNGPRHERVKWFADLIMKNNTDKCHLLVNTSEKDNIRIDNINRNV